MISKNRKTNISTIGFGLALGLAFAGSPAAFAQTGTLYVVGEQVGINVETPATGASLHVQAESTGPVDAIYLENLTGASRLRLVNQGIAETVTKAKEWTFNSNGDLRISAPELDGSGGGPEVRIFADGVIEVQGGFRVAGTDLTVPDFVFEDDYNLRPLSDVEAFVAQNGHLPDVPSASEVNQGGLDMTQMQLTLLRKVEELTLYTLQQQKTIDDLQSRLEDYSN